MTQQDGIKTHSTKNNILLESLFYYYNNSTNMQHLVEVLNEKSCISLRLIDWFVTKYSKINNIEYIWNNYNFNVFNSYKNQLKAYSKKQMDPFCRHKRVSLESNQSTIVTTCGQMNFFKWAIENGIFKYVMDNFNIIDIAMKTENKMSSKKNLPIFELKKKKKFTRKVFSTSTVPITIFFD
jgi:hypothetical protein